ncbi:MAG: hypothetical protein WCW26_02915 [Candidatus Buchananbacteria bacterium]
MIQFIKKAKTNIILSICAVAAIIYFSGTLGFGSFLRNYLAFGYGGGGGFVMLPEIVAVNKPLYIPSAQRGGRLFERTDDNISAVLEVPPLTVSGLTMFDIAINPVDASNQPCSGSNNIIGSKVFNIIAQTESGSQIYNFSRSLTVSLTLPNIPTDTSNLGIYYLNNNNQWVLGQKAIFDNVNNRTIFEVKDLGVVALINAPGLPPVIEAGSRCGQKVLGVKEYSDGTILRTCDGEAYIIKDKKINPLTKLPLTLATYQNKTVYDVDFSVVVELSGKKNVGKNYKDGELLRTCDWRIYRVENQKLRYINTWNELHDKYLGQKINNIDYWVLSEYQQYSTGQQVLGAKQYADGTLLRTADGKIYILENQKANQISSVAELNSKYAGQKIYNIANEVLVQYLGSGASVEFNYNKVLGVKNYADGTYLRTRDWKVYVIENQKAKQIATMVPGSQDYYQGQKIYDVDYGVIAQYTTQQTPAATQQVLGVKQYADGTLLKAPDGIIYIVVNQKVRVATAAEQKNTAGQKIYDVDYETINNYGAQSVLGVKRYANGTYLKTPDWRLYIISDQKARYIDTIATTLSSYNGQPVYNVDYEVLAQY